MRVLSLFDGISCGQVALERAGIPVEVYYSSEIDKYAIQITQKNYPNTVQLGDINNIDFTQFIGKVDLIMGGSPCQDLSIAGKRKGLAGERSGLFYKFVEAIEVIKPKYFLLENNVGMPKEAYEEISRLMGCYPVLINSALVSAQTRKRYYWTNIGPQLINLLGVKTCNIPQPINKGILLKDVLESGYGVAVENQGKQINHTQDKSCCLMARDYKGFGNQQMTGVAEPSCADRIYDVNGKSVALTSGWKPNIAEPICVNIPETVTVRKYEVDTDKLKTVLREHKNLTNKEIAEKLNQPITKVEHWFRTDDGFAIPDSAIWLQLKELLNIQTDEFDKSMMEFEEKPNEYDKASRDLGKGQAQKVYSVRGKSVSLLANGGGQGGKTGLYKIDLPDGDYIIRKLTPIECERLQTLPDNYTEYGTEGKISNAQRYKAIGNGWTVDVIAHIFSFLKDREV